MVNKYKLLAKYIIYLLVFLMLTIACIYIAIVYNVRASISNDFIYKNAENVTKDKDMYSNSAHVIYSVKANFPPSQVRDYLDKMLHAKGFTIDDRNMNGEWFSYIDTFGVVGHRGEVVHRLIEYWSNENEKKLAILMLSYYSQPSEPSSANNLAKYAPANDRLEVSFLVKPKINEFIGDVLKAIDALLVFSGLALAVLFFLTIATKLVMKYR